MRLSSNYDFTSGGREGERVVDDHEQEDRVGWSESAKHCAVGACFGDGGAPPYESGEVDDERLVSLCRL